MVAESGYYYKFKDDDEWESMGIDTDPTWKDVVRPIMQVYQILYLKISCCSGIF